MNYLENINYVSSVLFNKVNIIFIPILYNIKIIMSIFYYIIYYYKIDYIIKSLYNKRKKYIL